MVVMGPDSPDDDSCDLRHVRERSDSMTRPDSGSVAGDRCPFRNGYRRSSSTFAAEEDQDADGSKGDKPQCVSVRELYESK